jgi:hypothetical protein
MDDRTSKKQAPETQYQLEKMAKRLEKLEEENQGLKEAI